MATSTAHRRLLQEYRALTNNPPEGITAGPVSEDDLLYWEALIQGPEGTPFEGGVFAAELKFPKDYPLAPPSMRFLGEVWHPNGTFSSLPRSQPSPCPYCEKPQAHCDANAPPSLPFRSSMHLDPAPSRRGPKPLRARVGAVVADPERREDTD
jgi:Ubiquitin-conjugating enzyme